MPEAGAKNLPAVGVRPVLVAAFGTYRRRFGLIAGAALVVFGISAGLDVLVNAVNDRVSEHPGLVATLLVVASLATFGTTFFAGLLDRIVGEEERGHPRRPLGELLRTLPYWRLLAADVLLSLGAVFATILLIVPGLIFYTYFSLVGPAVVMEDRKVFDAFRRSMRLVRGKFWLDLSPGHTPAPRRGGCRPRGRRPGRRREPVPRVRRERARRCCGRIGHRARRGHARRPVGDAQARPRGRSREPAQPLTEQHHAEDEEQHGHHRGIVCRE